VARRQGERGAQPARQSEQLDEDELFVGADGDSERASRRELLKHLVEAGAEPDQLKDAAREGGAHDEWRVADRLLDTGAKPSPRCWTP
jgi:hypothetical protein